MEQDSFRYIFLQIPSPGISYFMEMLVALLLFLQAAPTIRSQTTPPPVEDNNDLWALVGALYQQKCLSSLSDNPRAWRQ